MTTEHTEYQVIGEAYLDTIPIRKVGWSSPETFETLEEAEACRDRHRFADPGAINPRVRQRTVSPWTDLPEAQR